MIVDILIQTIGQQVEIADGQGNVYLAQLESFNNDKASFTILERSHFTTHCLPVIAIAIPKSPSRWETFLEKATEIGVKEIIPMLCKRSEKNKLRRDRSEQIILSAFKQSLQPCLPKLRSVTPFEEVLMTTTETPQKFIAHCNVNEDDYFGVSYKKKQKGN